MPTRNRRTLSPRDALCCLGVVIAILVLASVTALGDTIFSDSFSGSYPSSWFIGHDEGSVGGYSWAWPYDYAHCCADPNGAIYYHANDLHTQKERGTTPRFQGAGYDPQALREGGQDASRARADHPNAVTACEATESPAVVVNVAVASYDGGTGTVVLDMQAVAQIHNPDIQAEILCLPLSGCEFLETGLSALAPGGHLRKTVVVTNASCSFVVRSRLHSQTKTTPWSSTEYVISITNGHAAIRRDAGLLWKALGTTESAYLTEEMATEVDSQGNTRVIKKIVCPSLPIDEQESFPVQADSAPNTLSVTPLGSGTIDVQGSFFYPAPGGDYNPIRYATVVLYDQDLLGPVELRRGSTDANGNYSFADVPNDDGWLQGGMDVFVEVRTDYYVTDRGLYVNDGSLFAAYYVGGTETRGDVPDGTTVDFGAYAITGGAFKVLDDGVTAHRFFLDHGWSNPKVLLIWPASDGPLFAGNPGFFGIFSSYEIRIPNLSTSQYPYATGHEYAHAVMYKMYGDRIPSGSSHPSPHSRWTESCVEFALSEGWAEFCGDSITEDTSLDSERYADVDTPGNYDGEIVEGAVAETLWDVADGGESDDDGVPSKMSNIMYILQTHRPNSILEFKSDWNSIGYLYYEELQAIYYATKIDEPPPPPSLTGVSASDGTYCARVAVTWNASAGATEYRVYRNGSALSSWQSGTSYNDYSATPGTTYSYQAKARNSCGESNLSSPDSGSRRAFFTLSGYVVRTSGSGISGVAMVGLPCNPTPITEADGYYECNVPCGWSGTATPQKAGYEFCPPSRSYVGVMSDQTGGDYIGIPSSACTDIVGAKSKADGTEVRLSGVVTGLFRDCFYVEDENRCAGIHVAMDQGTHQLSVGDRAVVSGILAGGAAERCIVASCVYSIGTATVAPVGMNIRALGGADWLYDPVTGSGQKGIAGAIGLNNIGLLIRTWGKVTYADTDYFYLDDGSVLDDGSGNPGAKVLAEGLTLPAQDKHVQVTGISSCFKVGDDLHRLIRVRDQADVVAME